MIEARIKELDETTATQLLQSITRPKLRSGVYERELTPELRQALRDQFELETDTPPTTTVPASGDLARTALLFLANDPDVRPALETMLDNPDAPEQFGVDASTVALLTAALVALQTEVRFKRTQTGKVSVEVIKHPASMADLIQYIRDLFNFAQKP